MSFWYIPISVWTFLCSLAEEVPSSSCTLYLDPDLESAIFPRIPGSFSWKLVLSNQELGGAHYYWAVIASKPFQWTEPGGVFYFKSWLYLDSPNSNLTSQGSSSFIPSPYFYLLSPTVRTLVFTNINTFYSFAPPYNITNTVRITTPIPLPTTNVLIKFKIVCCFFLILRI